MGIKGLLSHVDQACKDSNISNFKGKTVAIDASCLLHRALHSISLHRKGITPSFYVKLFLQMLKSYEIKIYLVFDGKPLIEKRKVLSDRQKYKNLALQKYQATGNTNYYLRSRNLTSRTIEETIIGCNEMSNVHIIKSPHEADAQLAYLVKKGYVDAVITEDSDLIVYGCDTIIYKLKLNGECLEYNKYKLSEIFENFDFESFRMACILAGCDYMPKGFRGYGLKTACKKLENVPKKYLNNFLINLLGNDYEMFDKAHKIFLHQRVYDPILNDLIFVNFDIV